MSAAYPPPDNSPPPRPWIVQMGGFLVGGLLLAIAAGAGLLALLFSQILGWGCASVVSLFFTEVLLLFLYSHPLGAYLDKAEILPYLAGWPLRQIGETLRYSIYVITAALGLVLFGWACPDILKFCVPSYRPELGPYYMGEIILLYFIYTLMIKRVVNLFTASHTLRYELIRSDLLFIAQHSPAESESRRHQQQALEEELAKIRRQVQTVRQRNYLFAAVFVLFSFVALFIHAYCLSYVYFQHPWGLPLFITLSALYIISCLALHRLI